METDLPSVNLLQKNVTGSFERARENYEAFARVQQYRVASTTNVQQEEWAFVETTAQMA